MNIGLKLHIRNYNGGPGIRVFWNKGKMFDRVIDKKGLHSINFETEDFVLPNTLVVEMYNKNMRHDTKLDEKKNIVDDKACYISEVSFGDIRLTNELFLFEFRKNSGEVITNNVYMGFNGRFTIDLATDNIHAWYNGLQKHLITNTEQFDYDKFKTEIFGIKKTNYSIKY